MIGNGPPILADHVQTFLESEEGLKSANSRTPMFRWILSSCAI